MFLLLGTPVRFSAVLERQEIDLTAARGGIPHYEQHWLPIPRDGSGILVGYRTLTNGYTHRWSEDGYMLREWKHTSTVRCALVAFSLYRRPVFVPLDNLTNENRGIKTGDSETNGSHPLSEGRSGMDQKGDSGKQTANS